MNNKASDYRTPVTDEQIISALSRFRIQASGEQVLKIREYIRLLLKWNLSISLTTVVDPGEILERHFGESMYLHTILPVENCRLADIGTGAGFPGLALKILAPSLRLILVESNKKKCVFLSEVVRTLGFADVTVSDGRFEEIRAASDFADIIAARALGGLSDLLRWSKTALLPGGHIALWVGGEDATVISHTLGWTWRPPEQIPESKRRFILVGLPDATSGPGLDHHGS